MVSSRVEVRRSKRPFAAALWSAVVYALPTALLLGYTWHNTKPVYHGFDWILIGMLTYPTCVIIDLYFPSAVPVLIGLRVNAAAVYLLGRLVCHVAKRYRRFFW